MSSHVSGRYKYVDPQPATARAGDSVTVGYEDEYSGKDIFYIGWHETNAGAPVKNTELHDPDSFSYGSGQYNFTMPDEDVTVLMMCEGETVVM